MLCIHVVEARGLLFYSGAILCFMLLRDLDPLMLASLLYFLTVHAQL